MVDGEMYRARGGGSFRLPSFKEDSRSSRVQRPQLKCESTAVPPLPKSHLCVMEKPHVSPELEAGGERWSERGIQETEQTEKKDAFHRAGWPHTGLIKRPGAFGDQRCSHTVPDDQGPVRRQGSTQKNEGHASAAGPQTHPRSSIQSRSHFLWQQSLFIWGNESTALMKNAGEGTPGTGPWEGKFEQKKPF